MNPQSLTGCIESTVVRLLSHFLVAALLTAALGEARLPPLSDFQGTYEYENGETLEIIAGRQLFAVVDEAKYPLKRAGEDSFATTGDESVIFVRDASGQVKGYEYNSKLYLRVSWHVSAASEDLAYPRSVHGSYHYSIPKQLDDGIAAGDIANTPLGLKVANEIGAGILSEKWPDVHSVLLYQGGKLVLEEYFYGYTRDRTHQLRSATKSIVSALAGIAITRRSLSGVNEPVLRRLAYRSYAHPDPRKPQITLGQFLSMSSGLDCNDHSASSPGRETVIDERPDWVKATLDLPMIHDPGRVGYYCSGGVAVVGRVIEKATRTYLPDFAQANLFSPLGIALTDWVWNYDLTNNDKEFSQIHLRPRDMLKLGILYAQGGQWKGKQVISADWVNASLAHHSTVDGTEYGYFWWHPWLRVNTSRGEQHVFLHSAQGNGGQKIYIVPELKLVAVFTGGAYNMGGSPPNKIMASVILPALLR